MRLGYDPIGGEGNLRNLIRARAYSSVLHGEGNGDGVDGATGCCKGNGAAVIAGCETGPIDRDRDRQATISGHAAPGRGDGEPGRTGFGGEADRCRAEITECHCAGGTG